MASVLYNRGREGILDGTISVTGDVRAMLVGSAYTFNSAHQFLADLGGNDNGRTTALAAKTYDAGVFDAADTSLATISGILCSAIVIFQHTGSDATARLIAYIDTAPGLPFTPAPAQTILLAWDNGANKIFKL